MCLDLNFFNIFSKTASEDIVCYKYLCTKPPRFMRNYTSSQGNGKTYYTPYKYMPVKIGTTYSSNILRQGLTVSIALHSFSSYESLDKFREDDTVKVECLIPKGSKYYVGKFLGYESYASDKIEYIKIIE